MRTCPKCERSVLPSVTVVAIDGRTDPRVLEIKRKMDEKGWCWFCAAGITPCSTARGGVSPYTEASRKL